jgi:hypothetical protein
VRKLSNNGIDFIKQFAEKIPVLALRTDLSFELAKRIIDTIRNFSTGKNITLIEQQYALILSIYMLLTLYSQEGESKHEVKH